MELKVKQNSTHDILWKDVSCSFHCRKKKFVHLCKMLQVQERWVCALMGKYGPRNLGLTWND